MRNSSAVKQRLARPKLSLYRAELFLYRPKLSLYRAELFLHRPKQSLRRPELSLYRSMQPLHRPELFLYRPTQPVRRPCGTFVSRFGETALAGGVSPRRARVRIGARSGATQERAPAGGKPLCRPAGALGSRRTPTGGLRHRLTLLRCSAARSPLTLQRSGPSCAPCRCVEVARPPPKEMS